GRTLPSSTLGSPIIWNDGSQTRPASAPPHARSLREGEPTVKTSESAESGPERQLLEEGAESYVAAVSAILTFRRMVQARCRRVVDRRLREYGAALGVRLDRCQFLDAEWPKASAWEGDWASVGLEIRKV